VFGLLFSRFPSRKGQLSIEFFLVLSIIIAFSIILYNVSRDEVANTRATTAIVVVKSSLDSLSQAVDFVALSGNGSALNFTAFVPREANCIYYNSTRNSFYCVIYSPSLQREGASQQFVFGPPLAARLAKQFESSCTGSFPLRPGWWELRAASVGGAVNVSCFPR
jgi:uncharacterized protein (UPF0333 family)